ncbi:hypothetical protein [Parabacteroides pacaensis]|uniref:hypothetical protein n=1 Tax=Parabacteroides pacaensis TaxID=2086575 RepID=UPI000D0F809C|nr:hypothetical protein [Parabacteroides pacaensis]
MKTLSAIKLQNYEKINNVEQAQMKGGIGWDTFFRGLAVGVVEAFPPALASVAVSVIAGYLVEYFTNNSKGGEKILIPTSEGLLSVPVPQGTTMDSLIYRGPDGQHLSIYGYDSK